MKKITTFFFLSLMTLATFAQQPELFSDQMGKYGYRDASGKEIVPLKYDNAGDFAEERARVCVGGQYDDLTGDWWGGKWGFIDMGVY